MDNEKKDPNLFSERVKTPKLDANCGLLLKFDF